MRPARWGIWLLCQNVCQRSETKGFCNSLIQHVSRVHGSLLLSIPCGFFCCCRFIFSVFISHVIKTKNRNRWINYLAKNQLFFIRALFAEVCYPNLQSFVWRRQVGAHQDGHQHGGRKPTEISLEELKNNTVLLFSNVRTVQMAKFPEISLGISHFLTSSAVM